jgi:NADH-quinone oxidoreductase subunit K
MNFTVQTISILTILGLIGIGLYCILISKNLIKVVVGLQIGVKGAMLAMVLAGKLTGNVSLGQSLALTIIVADTIVAVVALALAVQVKRKLGTLDLSVLSTLRR